jgi:hypothetical protein
MDKIKEDLEWWKIVYAKLEISKAAGTYFKEERIVRLYD